MRYRKLSDDGDYTFGGSLNDFYIDSPEAVGQAVLTRLRLLRGEWFLDNQVGVPYSTEVLGKTTLSTADAALRGAILATPGVTALVSYSSTLDNRQLTVQATINTQYGQTTVSTTL